MRPRLSGARKNGTSLGHGTGHVRSRLWLWVMAGRTTTEHEAEGPLPDMVNWAGEERLRVP